MYTCPGQTAAHFALSPVVMKWCHTVCFSDDFFSKWQATETACELAMDFDYYTSHQSCTSSSSKRVTTACRDRRVHFQDYVEVAIGNADADVFEFDSIRMPQSAFAVWTGKPWRLKGIHQCRTTDEFYNVPSNWHSASEEPGGDDADDFPVFLHEAPGAIQNLYDQFLHHGYIDGPRLNEHVFLRSWYLHHAQVHRWYEPRTIELHGHWRHWRHDILSGWRDQVFEGQDIGLYLCRPDPPRPAAQVAYTFDLLVVQGTWLPCSAGLITVLRPNDPAARAQYAVAISLTEFVCGVQLAHGVDVEHHCFTNDCMIRHGRTVIPFSMDPVHEMNDGDSFTITPITPLGESEAAPPAAQPQDEVLRNAEEEHDFDFDQDGPPDDTEPYEPDDPMSDPSSDSQPSAAPQALHIFRLGHPATFGHVDWTTYHSALRDVAQLIGLRPNAIPAIHYVNARLDGLQDVEEAIVVQHLRDLPIGSLEKLIILDIRLHFRNAGGRIPAPPEVDRRVHRVMPQLTRSHVLLLAGLEFYCAWVHNQCLVYIDNELWDPRDFRLRDIAHGTYLKIQVPPPPAPHWNTPAAVRVAQDVGDSVSPADAPGLISQILSVEFEADHGPIFAPHPRQHKPCDLDGDVDAPMTYAPGERMPTVRPRHDGNFQWLNDLVNVFAVEAEAEVLDGSPLLYVQTWFVHHEHFPRCEAPRPIRLDNAIITWIEEFRYAWRDVWDYNIPFSIHLVRPRPPQPRHHGYACHLLFEQAKPPRRVAGVITHLFEGPDRDALQQYATSLPSILRRQDTIDELRLQPFCDFRRCTLTVGGRPLHLIEAHDTASGFNLCVRIASVEDQLPVPPRDDHFADLAFLQTHLHVLAPHLSSSDTVTGRTGSAAEPHRPPSSNILRLDLLTCEAELFRQTNLLLQWITQFQDSVVRPLDDVPDGAVMDSDLTGESRVPDAGCLQIDMRSIFTRLESFDQSFLVPHFALGLRHTFHPWLMNWWDCQSAITRLWIYHDGARSDAGAGAAAVAFVFQPENGWLFAGALSFAGPPGTTSYRAELYGGLLAVQFCIDLLKILEMYQDEPPEVYLFHDNTAVGNQLTGRWHAHADSALVSVLRHLVLYTEHRFRCQLCTCYVAAHQGEPGNELADQLAGEAASGHPLADLQHWFDTIVDPAFQQAVAWFWLPFCARFRTWWTGTSMCLPSMATTKPSLAVLPKPLVSSEEVCTGIIDCTVGTCPVLTLKSGKGPPLPPTLTGLSGPTRQTIVFQQFYDAGVCIFALQETRLQRSCKDLLGYHIIKGAAAPGGHHGIILAVSTTLPYGHYIDGHGNRHALHFSAQDLSIIATDPRFVIVRLHTDWLKCLLIAGHAPHSGHDLTDIEHWWHVLYERIPRAYADWPILLLTDANAKVGSDTCPQIGDSGAEAGGDKALPFTSFIREHGLWLPSTFSCHQGPFGTWCHPSGKWLRNDFVGLPIEWTLSSCTSRVSDDIDVSLQHDDHKAALVRFTMDVCSKPVGRLPRPFKHHAETADLSALRTAPAADPALDIHSHAAYSQQQVLECLPRPQRQPIRKRKTTMSDATWQLVLQKRDWRRALHDLQALQKTTLLQACFVAWRTSHALIRSDDSFSLLHSYDALLRDQDRSIASALYEFHCLGRLVAQCSRKDDSNFYFALLQEGADFLSPNQSRELWRVIKRSLPKYKQRRLDVDPLRLLALEDAWNPHFEALEAGCVLPPDALLDGLHVHPSMARLDQPPTLADIPTIFDFEQVLRANKTGRATGYDPLPSALYHNHAPELAEHYFDLFLKMWCWGDEPIQFKGGPMALIPKCLNPRTVQQYRGILLLPTLAKGIHALVRQRIMSLLHHKRHPGQLGGFRQQEVLYGSHALRILGHAAQLKHLSVGVLFVDLSTAFHALIREFVVGVGDSSKLHYVFEALAWSDNAQQRLQLGHLLPNLLEQLGAPPFLVRLLQSLHDSTWTTINGRDYIRTHRGTRPGSPIADAIFHYIMYDFSTVLHDYLLRMGHAQFVQDHLQMECDMIIWSDDLAVPIVTSSADELVPALLRLLDFIKQQFADRGLRLNLARGKTGLVATFLGPDAASMRRRFQLVPQPGVWHQFDDDEEAFIHMTPSYRHLGTMYTSDQKLDTEISFRIGVAVSAFETLKRPLLTNRHLPQQLRLQLLRTLVLTKLYFGAGTWHTLPGRLLDRLRTTLSRMLRRVMGCPVQTISTAALFAKAGLLEPRARLAMERLLYAQRLFHHGPAFLQLMLHAECLHGSNAWIVGLQHDLRWLHGVEALPDPILLAPDLTALIDLWQADTGKWKKRVKRAGTRHLFQEAMILEVQQWHADIFAVLRTHAFSFAPDPGVLRVQERHFPCPDCPRWFTTPQGVHTHRRKVHGVYCPEHHLLDSATCPACLTFLWNTQRLQQHLSYMPRDGTPNACFAYLQTIGYSVSYSATHLPVAQRGQSRLDALPTDGPYGHGLSARERHLGALRSERQALEAVIMSYTQPEDATGAGSRLGDLLSATTHAWYRDYVDAAHCWDLIERPYDRWLDVLCRLPSDFESWTARVFVLWGRHLLPDLCDALHDGDAAAYLDAEYAELIDEFDEYHAENQLQRLDRQIAAAQREPPEPGPHRPVRPPQQNARPRSQPQHDVGRLFDGQEAWQDGLRRVEWLDMPCGGATPLTPGIAPRPSFIIVHLFCWAQASR